MKKLLLKLFCLILITIPVIAYLLGMVYFPIQVMQSAFILIGLAIYFLAMYPAGISLYEIWFERRK